MIRNSEAYLNNSIGLSQYFNMIKNLNNLLVKTQIFVNNNSVAKTIGI